MKKIFITGGSGTVGTAFIKKYYNDYKFYSYSRGEKSQVSLKRKFPNIEIIIGGIEEKNYFNIIKNFIKKNIMINEMYFENKDSIYYKNLNKIFGKIFLHLENINSIEMTYKGIFPHL